jgi:5-formyltetrahydrofolate cyclo-ligase
MAAVDDLAAAKAAARAEALARRKAAHAMRGEGAADLLRGVLSPHRGTPLAGFLPIRTEIDPRPAMAEAAEIGPVGVPVILGAGRALAFSRWTPDGALRDGPFGAQVPEVDDWVTPEVLIVPLLAFTRRGDRLGYGGGFYDRTLAALRGAGPVLAVGFAYAAQELPELPTEPTDQRLDLIVTETDVIQPE